MECLYIYMEYIHIYSNNTKWAHCVVFIHSYTHITIIIQGEKKKVYRYNTLKYWEKQGNSDDEDGMIIGV